jgi:PAS domain S-box-containing protein
MDGAAKVYGKDRSIARRLTVSLMITVGIVSCMTVGPIYYQEAQKNNRELQQKADDIIAYQIGVLAKPLWDLDRQATRIVGETIVQNELVAQLVIKDYFGRVAFSYTNGDLSGSITRSAEVLHNDDFVGDVFISLTDKYWQSKNRHLLNSFVITIFFILCALTLVSGLLVRTYLRKPLDRLNAMVGAYARGEYEAIDSYQPYTEFKPFTQVLDKMARQIVGQLKDLATAEEKYRSIFENAIEGMFQSSPEGRYYSVNPAMAELLGYSSPAEMLSSITDIARQTYVSSDDRKRLNSLLERQGRVIEFETDLRRKDGSVISVAISARAVRDGDGITRYYEGYLVDITRRKKAIEALHQTTEQLALLLESLPIVAYTARAGGDFGITYVSNSIEEITGYPPESFTGDAAFWSGHLAAEDYRRIVDELPILLEKGRYRCEYRFRTADGSYRWFDDTRRLVHSPNGSSSHIAGTWRDVTEEKRLRSEADYRLQQVVMADKLASLGQVVAGVAHEVCNPNSFIACNVPILEETWRIFTPILDDFVEQNPGWRHRSLGIQELRQDMEQTIEHIKIGSDRINRIVSHLKDFVRTDEGVPPRLIQLNEVVETAMTIVGAQARRFVAEIEIALAPNLPPVMGYFQKLEQVFTNLVVNALHAIPDKNKGKLIIRTGYAHCGAVILQVEDNGAGMEPETVERIFEPFFTLRRDSGGTGLGLSVSYNLVQEHNGILGVLSRPAVGSRFTVFLPVTAEIRLDPRPALLCIHRDPDFTRDLLSYFAESGETLYVLHEPAGCLDFIEQHPEIDILFIDDATGGQFLADLATRFPLLTRILYGGGDDTEGIRQADYIVPAPLKVSQLKKILEQTTRQRL